MPAVALNPSELFAKTCGGCHTGGGNVVDGGQTLRASDLERNGLLNDEAALSTVVRLGKGKMPGYGEECAPRGACTFGARLSEADIATLAKYVLEQAKAGWPTP